MTTTLWLAALARAAETETFGEGEPPPFNAQLFSPAMGSHRLVWTEEVGTRLDPAFHSGVLFHYANDPLVWTSDSGRSVGVVTDVMQMDALLEGKLGPLRLGAILPVYLYSRGASSRGSALGDFGLDGKLVLVDRSRAPFGVGVAARVMLPTATTGLSLATEEVETEVQLVADQEIGRVLFAANVGAVDGPALQLEDLAINDFVVGRFGTSVAVGPHSGLSLEVGGRAALTAPLASDATEAEWLASTYLGLGGGAQLRLGGGTGIGSGIGSPDFRAMAGFSFAPGEHAAEAEGHASTSEHSADVQDAVADVNCPLDGPPPGMDVELVFVDAAHQPLATATTRVEGIADECGHGVTAAHEVVLEDAARKGPIGFQQSYDVSGTKVQVDLTLAPGAVPVAKLTGDRIELSEEVRFETASARILTDSYPLLDQISAVLQTHPEIERLRIEGHADERGEESYNLVLSKARAAAVRDYLVRHGVSANRLRSEGYGEMLAEGADPDGLAQSRRVDLFVEEWTD
ncbi:MAG: OmpA family protein [Myxococcota bacterium]